MESTLEILTTGKTERRGHRQWPDEVEARIVSERVRPGVTVNEVADPHGLKPIHLSWRTMARQDKLVRPALEDAWAVFPLAVQYVSGLPASLPAAPHYLR